MPSQDMSMATGPGRPPAMVRNALLTAALVCIGSLM